ncbi:MAG: PAS domain S-box protein [Gallionellaceae bacterium]|nr:PAS domain S-box protein [Gallionellaceae bacterium]
MTINQANPILDAAPGIYFMFDAEGRFAGWNRAGLETFGLTPEDVEHLRPLDVVPPDQRERVSQAIASILSGESVTLELDLIVADASRHTFYGTGLLMEHEGRPYVTGLFVDITERKQAEARLRRSNEILECVSRLLTLYVGDSDADTVFSTALADILRLTGSQYGFIAELKHEADGTPYLQSLAITRMDWSEAARRFYDENAPSGFRFSARDSLAAAVLDGAPVIANDPAHDPRSCGRLPPGHPSLDAFLGLPLLRGGKILGSIGLANRVGGYDEALVAELRPVVEACAQLVAACHSERARQRTEMELRARERELDSIVENIPHMLFVKDAATLRFVRFNRAGEEMMGVSREKMLGRNDHDLVPKEQADFYTACDRQVLASGDPLDIAEEPHTSLTGTRTLHTRKVCIRGEDGQPQFLLGIAEDISERKRHADTLRMYERMVSCMPDHISVLDRDYRYLAVNDTYLQHHGLPREAIVGHSVAELLGQKTFDTLVKEKLDRCLAGERVQYQDWFDFPATGQRFVDVTYTPYQDDDGRITGVIVAGRDLTDLELIHQALMETESRYRQMVDQVADALYIHDQHGRLVDVNQCACDDLGYSRAELLDMGVLEVEREVPLDAAQAMWESLQPGQIVTLKGSHRRRDGTVFPVEVHLRCFDMQGQRLIAALARDISERVQAEEKVRQAAVVFDNAQEGIIVTDRNARILAVNPAFCEITGYSEAEVLGKTPGSFKSGRHDAAFYQAMWGKLIETGRWQGEVWDRRRDGEVYPKWLSISAVRDANGQTLRYVALFADITHLKESEARLEHLAHFDVLTDLPNRLLFNSRLEHALERARRHDEHIALLFLDLDRFKTVNDSLGHPAGDELLIAVARRIRKRLRDEDTLARLGGDEFVILLEQLDEAQRAAVVAQDVLQVLAEPIQLSGGHEVFIGCSIGISLYPDDADDATRLVSSADAALYLAKEQGRNTYCFYTEALTTAANEHLALETRLRRALERGEFVLHYQPLIDAHSGRTVGVEALVRWQPPDEALVPPDKFIPIAEETGLIVPLGEWVLRTACAQARAWIDAGLPPLVMAVNLSGRQFQAVDMVELVRAVLLDTGLPASYLELELTESVIMAHADQAIATLDALKALGVRLAIDDFGTGYSSLAYLKRFPIDKLKIDRSFVDGLADDPNDREIAATIIAMARSLNLDVLAEGVETEQQLAFLRLYGCDQYQGYLFSRPLPAEELLPLLRSA